MLWKLMLYLHSLRSRKLLYVSVVFCNNIKNSETVIEISIVVTLRKKIHKHLCYYEEYKGKFLE